MAEKLAHLTQTLQSKPSIFDFVAHEALNDLLYPSAKKIVDFLALRNRAFANLTKWFDECFLLNYSLLQFYYLKKYGATFSEKFYGLQRIPIKSEKNNLLGNKELWLSILTVSLFPYLRKKLNKICEELLLDHISQTNQKKRILLMKFLIYSNYGLNVIYDLLKFVQHLRFLSGATDINSPLLWAAGVKLKYADENLFESTLTLRNFIPQLLQRSLEVGAFFVQFLQWWQFEKSSSFNRVPLPPPPQKSENGIKFNDKCPLCLKKRSIETALSISGFVFCFKCITEYIMKYNQCPITKLPASVNHLIRIYPPT